MTTSTAKGPTPIPNTDRERLPTLSDLALCDITLEDFEMVQQWREKLFDPKHRPKICAELPRLLTESMRKSDKLQISPYERRCRALAHVFENKRAMVQQRDLLPGQTTTAFVGAVVYADTIGYCIWPELRSVSHRAQNPFDIDPETARLLNKDIFPYWLERRTIQERARYSDYDTADFADRETDRIAGTPGIDPPLKKRAGETPACQALFERVAFFLSDKATCVSHTVPDFKRLLDHGLDALIAQAKKDMNGADEAAAEMLGGVVRVFEAAKVYSRNLATAAEACGNQALAKICQNVPAKPATTLHEAVVSIWICYHLLLQENTNFGFSIGRLDQLLNPYYLKDWNALETDQEKTAFTRFAVELMCHFFLRCSDHVPLSTEGAEKLFAGSGSNQALTLGGTKMENGKVVDAVNDMTYIILKATELLSIRDPNVHVRYHADIHGCDPDGKPLTNGDVDPYLRRICQVNILTRATPAVHGDIPAVKAMSAYYAAHKGISEEEALADAVDYASIGCIEQNAAGKHYGNTGSTLFVLPAIIELALFGGKHRSSGVGPDDPNLFTGEKAHTTPPLVQMKSMDEFIEAFRVQLDTMARHAVQNNNLFGRFMAAHRPSPFLSGLFDGPTNLPGGETASFKDLAFGGAKYNSSGVAVIGLADVIDAFCVIDDLVFGGKLPAADLLLAMEQDFVPKDAATREKVSRFRSIVDFFLKLFGRLEESRSLSKREMDALLTAVRRAPKYGAGIETQDPYDNALAVKYGQLIPEMLKEVFFKYRNHRGGRYLPGYWSMTNHAGFGMLTKAMPTGRRDFESFAGGITPCPGISKRNGDPVNLFDHMLSVAKIDGEAVQNGYTYNLSLTTSGPDKFDDDTRRFADYMRTFTAEGGLLAQMCVSSIDRFIEADAAATRAEQTGAGEQEHAALAPYRDLMIRVAGYSAYFVTLSPLMRKEIIDRANFLIADGKEQHTGLRA